MTREQIIDYDRLATRIAENLIRGGMGERHASNHPVDVELKMRDIDHVMGHVHMDEDRDVQAVKPTDVPAIDRIFIALADLDRTLARVAVAAGRNTTLA